MTIIQLIPGSLSHCVRNGNRQRQPGENIAKLHLAVALINISRESSGWLGFSFNKHSPQREALSSTTTGSSEIKMNISAGKVVVLPTECNFRCTLALFRTPFCGLLWSFVVFSYFPAAVYEQMNT